MEIRVVTTASVANPIVGDLFLGDDNQPELATTLAVEVSQRLFVRFQFFKGEWFLNLDAGTPWFQDIFGRAVSDRLIRAVLSSVIVETEGVASVESLTYEIDPLTRNLSLNFKARLEDGTTFSTTEYGPFVVVISE